VRHGHRENVLCELIIGRAVSSLCAGRLWAVQRRMPAMLLGGKASRWDGVFWLEQTRATGTLYVLVKLAKTK